MMIVYKKVTALLVLIAAIAICLNSVAQTEGEGENMDRLLELLDELHATVPWYYEFSEHSTSKFKIPGGVINKVITKDLKKQFERKGAKVKLSAMGADAWPVVGLLLMDVVHAAYFEIAVHAAEILATIKADEHPDWPNLSLLLRGQSSSVQAFQHLLKKKPLNEPPHELFHRRFALIGMAAVGPAAEAAIPDIERVLRTKDDHALWMPAMKALKEISGDVTQPMQFLMTVVQEKEEWPRIRASAIKTLATSQPDTPETGEMLKLGLQDEMSRVRLAAAQELWRLNGKPEEVLSTLANLLKSKLTSVRISTLTTISEMGNSAQLIQSEVEQLSLDAKESVRQAAAKTLVVIRNTKPKK